MKRVIFTTYDDIDRAENKESHKYDGDAIATRDADIAKQKTIDEYFDRLVDNKQQYCDKIGVDFVLYRNTMKDFDIDCELEFAKVNIYKHHLMAELAKEYDEVMYVDMDVLFDTELNVFEENDLSKGIHVKHQDNQIISKNKEELLFDIIGLRSPTLKYHITKDLLGGQDNHVMNTGILIGKSEHIKQIKFIERTREVIKIIEKMKDGMLGNSQFAFSLITMSYYPNNESIFSYILEKYKIPYVLLEEKWHVIYSDLPPKDDQEGYIFHFINKQFGRFFKDKTKAIFSLHIDIPTDRLDSPQSHKDNPENKSAIAKRLMNEYRDRLLDNHRDYAKGIGADYKHFCRDEEYEAFYQRFPDLSEYDIVNLYKIWLLEKVSKEYDQVAYVDFDCVFHDHISVFDHVPCGHAICVFYETKKELKINEDAVYFAHYKKDFRNPQAKYWNAHAMCTEQGLDTKKNRAYNTGVMIASKQVMEQLDYFGDIDDTIAMMKELKNDEFSMYPSQVRASFGYDNETIFSYKIIQNNVLVYQLQSAWHSRNHYRGINTFDEGSAAWKIALAKMKHESLERHAVITHFISKNFSLFFQNK